MPCNEQAGDESGSETGGEEREPGSDSVSAAIAMTTVTQPSQVGNARVRSMAMPAATMLMGR